MPHALQGNIRPSDLSTDLGQPAQLFLQSLNQAQIAGEREKRTKLLEDEAARKEKERADIEGLIADITKPGNKRTPEQNAMTRLAAIAPDVAKTIAGIRTSGNEEQRKETLFAAKQLAKMSVFISSQDGFQAKQKAVRDLAGTVTLRGGNAQELLGMLNMSEPDLENSLIQNQVMATDVKTLMQVPKPTSVFGKANAELDAGLITQEQYEGIIIAEAQRLEAAGQGSAVEIFNAVLNEQGEIVGQRSSKTQRVVADPRAVKPTAQKAARSWLLPDGRNVISLDNGRTFKDPDTGLQTELPSDAVPLGPETAVQEVRAAKARRAAQKRLNKVAPKVANAPTFDAMTAAAGTGPWSNLSAAADAIIGGTFDLKTMFPKNADNRQLLRLIKQTGKSALLNSARGAVWEQQRIDELFPDPDKFWANPDTEARKIPLLRKTLLELHSLNDQLIASGAAEPKEISKLTASNADIQRSLALLGTGRPAQEGRGRSDGIASPQTNEDFDRLAPGSIYRDPDSGEIRRKK